MDCKTITKDKIKILYTYFTTLNIPGIIFANALNRFPTIHKKEDNEINQTLYAY